LIPALQFVHTQVYKYIFGKPADGLERSVEGEDECMSLYIPSSYCISSREDEIIERRRLTSRYVDIKSTAFNATYLDT
jgi:hypothetical protein